MVKIPDEEKELVLGALLHDIGKLVPGFEKTSHPVAGKKFIEEVINISEDVKKYVSDFVEKHMGDGTYPSEKGDILGIIKEADRLSAKSEREEREDQGIREYEPMESIFNYIQIYTSSNTKLFYPLIR